MKNIIYFLLLFLVSKNAFSQKMDLVRMLVATPYTDSIVYQSVGDVIAGTVAREFLRSGGIELLDREESEQIMRENGGEGWVVDRDQALFIGETMDADIVVYSSVQRENKIFRYNIAFYQVKNDILQRAINGSFKIEDSPSEIGRIMKNVVAELQNYVPLPTELNDPGINLRITTVDPDNLPLSHMIELPEGTRFGDVEQVFSHYRVYPGFENYLNFVEGSRIMKFEFSEEMDDDIRQRYNLYNTYGDYALRYNLQAYFIENCSSGVINLLVANNIPVFYADDVIVGYYDLASDGYCVFKTLHELYFDNLDMTYRDRQVVLFMVPKPGQYGGIPRDYLEEAISQFKDELGNQPKLEAITQGVLDLTSD